MGEVEIRKYLRYLRDEKKSSWSTINVAYNALRFFYIKTINRKFCVENIPYPKTEHKLPIVLAKSEVKSIIEASSNLKHKTIFMTLYSTGCRISEVSHLKVTDIDSKRMQVRVEQGKGKRDRYTLLSETLLIALRDYWHKYSPKTWLFYGYDKDKPLATRSIGRVFKDAKKKLA
jgi:site-specific recombinase XerD